MSDIPVFLAGETLDAGKLQTVAGLDAPYTPAFTGSVSDPALGVGGAAVGEWSQDGSMIDYFARIDFGTSGISGGSGTYRISLPVDAAVGLVAAQIGNARLADLSAPARRHFAVVVDTQSRVVIQDEVGASVTNLSPWTWAVTDWFTISVRYRMAG